MAAWEAARAVAVAAGVRVQANFNLWRGLWYRLTCGASVPHTFLALHLDRDTHFARGEVAATRHLRLAVPVYDKMLEVTGLFLQQLVVQTRELLDEGNPLWGYTPEQQRPRVTINHSARERAALRVAGDGQEGELGSEEEGDSDGEEEGDVDEDVLRAVKAALEAGEEARARELLRPFVEARLGGEEGEEDEEEGGGDDVVAGWLRHAGGE